MGFGRVREPVPRNDTLVLTAARSALLRVRFGFGCFYRVPLADTSTMVCLLSLLITRRFSPLYEAEASTSGFMVENSFQMKINYILFNFFNAGGIQGQLSQGC
jgi:hypothetical protein